MWTFYARSVEIFRVGRVDSSYISNGKYSELVMWTLLACLMKIFRVGHVDPPGMFNENIQSWSCGPSMDV